MKLAVVGTGYVGLVSGVCFAELGNEVVCVDKLAFKIEMLNNGEMPIYEPGLQDLMESNKKAGRLRFTTELKSAVQAAEIIIIAVGTPPQPNGEANLSYIQDVAIEIGQALNGYKIVVTKSTVPVGTNERVADWIREQTNEPFDIVSVPEFLREGSAVRDTLNPDRIIIGAESDRAADILELLHRPLTDQIVRTDIRSAEMIKYASNAFLATKISFINEIANICEKVGANVEEVAAGMGLDNRIGPAFLRAGIGYGGSCFPKDTQALIQIAGHVEYDFKLLKSVVEVNQLQRNGVIDKLHTSLGSLAGRTVGIWGLAFKPGTDDVREAPAIDIIQRLIEEGAVLKAYDPVAQDSFRKTYFGQEDYHHELQWCSNMWEAVEGCDALCLLTEWDQFVQADLKRIESSLRGNVLIDGRNVFQLKDVAGTRLQYFSVGRPIINPSRIDLAGIRLE
ncbi:UDP-glucose dehydrogenase family protein [Paenibacillus xylaniclasticus]|uniref:UDP-glucose dehydrogenase family protein n=1 Tax=Paenibacillus xylaniclasticus TaxID=588083 RepID=UPI000FD92A39|nr:MULTISPECIES: UDP-glucose/GDP-mannose dehydrogenase family protein [Paenibacillus]GFN32763.1 UDP-glucose 6-dehydrogenase TuaD [Paenibacillus curdlanolyticus]